MQPREWVAAKTQFAIRGKRSPAAVVDRELIDRHVARVIIKPQALDVWLVSRCEASAQTEDPSVHDLAPCGPPIPTITLVWTSDNRGRRVIRR